MSGGPDFNYRAERGLPDHLRAGIQIDAQSADDPAALFLCGQYADEVYVGRAPLLKHRLHFLLAGSLQLLLELRARGRIAGQ